MESLISSLLNAGADGAIALHKYEIIAPYELVVVLGITTRTTLNLGLMHYT